MERLMSTPLLTLRQVNEKLRNALLRFRPDLHQCSTILPGEFSSLRAELVRARKCLREVENTIPDPENASALAAEACKYHTNLRKLKQILPDLQMRLLTERSRLGKAQIHLAAAAAWARASKKTLQK